VSPRRSSRRRTAVLLAAVLLAVALLAAAPAAAQQLEVKARLEPQVLGVDDYAFFSIEVAGGVFSQVSFEPTFDLVNFEQIGGRAESSGVQWINGVSSRSLRLTWRLQPKELGLAAVQGISVRVGSDRFDLPAQEVRVVAEPPPSSRRRPPSSSRGPRSSWQLPDPLEDFFERRRQAVEQAEPKVRLVAEASPARAWAGQQVTYTLWLYTQTAIAQLNFKETPGFEGFWVEELPRLANGQPKPAQLDGEAYWRTPLLQRALFPLRPGSYDVDPAEVALVAQLSASPFSRLLPRNQAMVRASNPVTVEVRPLPPPPPQLADRFSGLVGDLSLDARLVPAELAVGDATTLELTLSGRGNVEGLATPHPVVPEGIEVLPAEESGGNQMQGQQVEAQRVWRYPLVPGRPGTWRLPPVEMAYFDPAAGEYRLAASDALVLRARRGAPELAVAGGPALHPIKNAALPVEEDRRPRVADALPWLFALPWAVVLVAALVRWRQGEGDDGDAGGARFAARLNEAAAVDRPRQSAILLEAAWHDLLAERYAVSAETAPSRWGEHLAAAGVPRRDADALDELVEDLHYLRNAPQLSTTAELTGELVERSRRLARHLVRRLAA